MIANRRVWGVCVTVWGWGVCRLMGVGNVCMHIPVQRGKRRTTLFRVILRLTPWKSGISLFSSGFREGFTLWVGK